MQTLISGCDSPWPELKYQHWQDTLKTIHQWSQIVGKIRLRSMPWQNHSWHTTLFVTSKGFSTHSMPYENGLFEIEFDFTTHRLNVLTTYDKTRHITLPGKSVAQFYQELFTLLKELNITVSIYGRPNELEESIPFSENTQNKAYDIQAVLNFWQAAVSMHTVFLKFRSGFIGKCSPVHLFWGAFDIAVTRFSGRSAPLHGGGIPNIPLEVMQEAYSQEVSSCGFWPGSDAFPEPLFYSYCYPTPPDFSNYKIQPGPAVWNNDMGEFILKYDEVRNAENPADFLLSFLDSTYEAAAETGKWDRQQLESKGV